MKSLLRSRAAGSLGGEFAGVAVSGMRLAVGARGLDEAMNCTAWRSSVGSIMGGTRKRINVGSGQHRVFVKMRMGLRCAWPSVNRSGRGNFRHRTEDRIRDECGTSGTSDLRNN